jgi:hypothetical protein
MPDNDFAKEQLQCMYRFRELYQTKRLEARKWCLGALSALPIVIITKCDLLKNGADKSLSTYLSIPEIQFAIFVSIAIIIFFLIYEIVLSTQEGVLDDKMWRLEEKLAKDIHFDLYEQGLLCRSRGKGGKEHLERSLPNESKQSFFSKLSEQKLLKLWKLTDALYSEEIILFYGLLLTISLIFLICLTLLSNISLYLKIISIIITVCILIILWKLRHSPKFFSNSKCGSIISWAVLIAGPLSTKLDCLAR